ncbi:hypothetical protein ACFVZX_20405, partial [Streptomyces erythrochromogenes]
MDLAEIGRVMRRRWYVLLPGLLLTAALTTAVHLLIPVEYQSQSTVTLLNSSKAPEAVVRNPTLSSASSHSGHADGLAPLLYSEGARSVRRGVG